MRYQAGEEKWHTQDGFDDANRMQRARGERKGVGEAVDRQEVDDPAGVVSLAGASGAAYTAKKYLSEGVRMEFGGLRGILRRWRVEPLVSIIIIIRGTPSRARRSSHKGFPPRRREPNILRRWREARVEPSMSIIAIRGTPSGARRSSHEGCPPRRQEPSAMARGRNMLCLVSYEENALSNGFRARHRHLVEKSVTLLKQFASCAATWNRLNPNSPAPPLPRFFFKGYEIDLGPMSLGSLNGSRHVLWISTKQIHSSTTNCPYRDNTATTCFWQPQRSSLHSVLFGAEMEALCSTFTFACSFSPADLAVSAAPTYTSSFSASPIKIAGPRAEAQARYRARNPERELEKARGRMKRLRDERLRRRESSEYLRATPLFKRYRLHVQKHRKIIYVDNANPALFRAQWARFQEKGGPPFDRDDAIFILRHAAENPPGPHPSEEEIGRRLSELNRCTLVAAIVPDDDEGEAAWERISHEGDLSDDDVEFLFRRAVPEPTLEGMEACTCLYGLKSILATQNAVSGDEFLKRGKMSEVCLPVLKPQAYLLGRRAMRGAAASLAFGHCVRLGLWALVPAGESCEQHSVGGRGDSAGDAAQWRQPPWSWGGRASAYGVSWRRDARVRVVWTPEVGRRQWVRDDLERKSGDWWDETCAPNDGAANPPKTSGIARWGLFFLLAGMVMPRNNFNLTPETEPTPMQPTSLCTAFSSKPPAAPSNPRAEAQARYRAQHHSVEKSKARERMGRLRKARREDAENLRRKQSSDTLRGTEFFALYRRHVRTCLSAVLSNPEAAKDRWDGPGRKLSADEVAASLGDIRLIFKFTDERAVASFDKLIAAGADLDDDDVEFMLRHAMPKPTLKNLICCTPSL
ncbi:hypothetical protein B0H11DRAFT_1920991 [Mycena galericulata]|nr:hypothetical protein B0H11DRAFT_1920991 [Mycena galericulata]